jgi:hypothetical protein
MSTPTLTFPMRRSYRAALALLAALGLVGFVHGVLELAGALGVPPPQRWVEGGVVLAFGLVVTPVALSALRVARVELTQRELRHLRIGLPCSLVALRLDALRRHGSVRERRKGRTRMILLLETHEGRRVQIQASMYERTAELLAAVRERSRLEPSPARATLTGVRFDDAG